MDMQWKEYMKEMVKNLQETDYVAPHEIPNIDLYMDQVTTFMDEHLESSKRFESDKLLTKTMINNYTKNGLLPPPEKKKYSKDHMYLLIFIYYLKNFLSISDVKKLINPMSSMFFHNDEMPLDKIYEEIFNMENSQAYEVAKDVMGKFINSKKMFEDVEGEQEKDYLRMFSFIAMLSFDVYLKKAVIQNIIDNTFGNNDSSNGKDKK